MTITRDQIIDDIFKKDGILITKDDPLMKFIAIHEHLFEYKVKQLNKEQEKTREILSQSIQEITQDYGNQIKDYTEQYGNNFFNEADDFLDKKFNTLSSRLISDLEKKANEIESLRSQFAYPMWITVTLTIINLMVAIALIYHFF